MFSTKKIAVVDVVLFFFFFKNFILDPSHFKCFRVCVEVFLRNVDVKDYEFDKQNIVLYISSKY